MQMKDNNLTVVSPKHVFYAQKDIYKDTAEKTHSIKVVSNHGTILKLFYEEENLLLEDLQALHCSIPSR